MVIETLMTPNSVGYRIHKILLNDQKNYLILHFLSVGENQRTNALRRLQGLRYIGNIKYGHRDTDDAEFSEPY